jgi:hypothetical protein
MMLIGLVLIALFAVLLIWILYQRLVADGIMIVLFTFAPLMVPLLFFRSTRAQGMMWIRTYVALSLYVPITAGMLQVLDKVAFVFSRKAAFDVPIVHAVMGLVVLGVITQVPMLTNKITGGGIEMSAWGAPRLRTIARLLPVPFL